MKIKKILCPVDYSDFSEPLIKYAYSLAIAEGAEVCFLHTFKSYEASGSNFSAKQVQEEELRQIKQIVDYVPKAEGVKATFHVAFAMPADGIVEFADKNQIDMIVIGTHGRTGISRLVMGSVAEAVIRHANCPVMTVKIPDRVPA